jgi:ribose-phosphate pyrophosphokinase
MQDVQRIFNGMAKHIKQDMSAEGIQYGISLGRRAPMHIMHMDCILEMVNAGLKPAIFIGSTNGPDSPLYDPVRNPMTIEQQKEQLNQALPGLNLNTAFIITLEDHEDDKIWLKNLVKKIKDSGLYDKSVVHFRSKAADHVKDDAPVKPLNQYVQAFVDEGLAVWQSYNSDSADDNISATNLRFYDLENLTTDQRNVIAAPDYLINLARQARANNPDKHLLEAHQVPLTVLDLALERLRLEVGIPTADVIDFAQKSGEVTEKLLTKAASDLVKTMHSRAKHEKNLPPKPLLVIGNSVSPETAAYLKEDILFETIGASIGKFQSDEPFTELFYGENADFEVNAEKVKGAKAFVVQSTAEPVSDNVQHLLEIIHTLKSCGAAEVTAVIPFTAFSRQDRSFKNRFTSVAADLFAKQLKAAGADKVISFTTHSQAAIQFYKDAFGSDFTNLATTDVFASYLKNKFYFTSSQIISGAPDGAEKLQDEGQKRAKELTTALVGRFNEQSMFRISKIHTAASDSKITSFSGDVADKNCVIIDDMVDGGSTMLNAAKMLKENGAKSVTCCFTHAILTKGNGTALEKLMTAKDGASYFIDTLVMTDSIPEAAEKVKEFSKQYPDLAKKINIIPLGATILAEIKRQLTAAPIPAAKPENRKPV